MDSPTGSTDSSNQVATPVSLSDLKSMVEKDNEEIRNCQASHDFYMSMWKSAPYAIIALAPATVYASFIDIYYAAGPAIAGSLITLAGVIGWYKQESLNERIEKKLNLVNTRKRQLERRIIKVETEFKNLKPNNTLCYPENFRFDDSLVYWQHTDYGKTIVAQILDDMKYYDGDLLRMRMDYDRISNNLIDALKLFYEAAFGLMTGLNRSAGINLSKDSFPPGIHAAYYVMSNLVGSVVDVKPDIGRPRVNVGSNIICHFIELLFGEKSASNPYPSILSSVELRNLANEIEELRKQALRAYTTVDEMIRVKYQE